MVFVLKHCTMRIEGVWIKINTSSKSPLIYSQWSYLSLSLGLKMVTVNFQEYKHYGNIIDNAYLGIPLVVLFLTL